MDTDMGYTTEFKGRFKLNTPLKPEHQAYLLAFSEHRHCQWDIEKVKLLSDPIREAANLPIGTDAGYFVGNVPDKSFVMNSNKAPSSQPGLYCKWVPSEDGEGIEWNGEEKFYFWEEWLWYLLVEFLEPWGYILNGTVTWKAEAEDDYGVIIMRDNIDEVIWQGKG